MPPSHNMILYVIAAGGAISVADLMAMSSGLEFNEDYGDVTDVTRGEAA